MENDLPGPMTMIKIDGSKIKHSREQQGLTQLYLATAVGVTTDTISRWENKRYPSIKKENGLKLAEALGVDLEDILEQIEDTPLETPEKELKASPAPPHTPVPKKEFGIKKIWPLLLLSATLFSIIAAFGYYYFYHILDSRLTATRMLPPHTTIGQPFPVLLQLNCDISEPKALIIREFFPPDSNIHATSPDVNSNGIKNSQIKWLGKIQGKAVFAYLISINDADITSKIFKGTASIRDGSVYEINGDSQIELGPHHWADFNADNVISDKEILMVYDYYSDIPGLALDIDFIEEIWMGDGYKWNPSNSQYKILE